MALSSHWVAQGQVPPSYKVSLAAPAFELIDAAKIAAILPAEKKSPDQQRFMKVLPRIYPAAGQSFRKAQGQSRVNSLGAIARMVGDQAEPRNGDAAVHKIIHSNFKRSSGRGVTET